MANDGEKFEQYMHGYVRWIYYNGDQNTAEPSFPWYIWEGGTKGSYAKMDSFGRYLDAWQNLAIGWWNPTQELSMNG